MLTIIIEIIAVRGVPNQLMQVVAPWQNGACSPAFITQLMTLKVGSNIQRHASVDSTLGMIHGNKSAARVNLWPGKLWFSKSAIASPSKNFTIVVKKVYAKVLMNESRNTPSRAASKT